MISQLTFLLSNNLSDKSQFNLDIMTEPQLTGGLEGVEGPNSIGGNKTNFQWKEKPFLFDKGHTKYFSPLETIQPLDQRSSTN